MQTRRLASLFDYYMSMRFFPDYATLLVSLDKPAKEFSEAASLLKEIRKHVSKRRRWLLVDLCSGPRALLSALAVLTLKSVYAVAVDKRPPDPALTSLALERFTYLQVSLFDPSLVTRLRRLVAKTGTSRTVVAGIHCCKTLAPTLIDIAAELGASFYLVPCCEDHSWAIKAGCYRGKGYENWTRALACYAARRGFRVGIRRLEEMLSPKNILITGLPGSKTTGSRGV